ncbi:hypothetical protein [Streptomyces sp. NPDC094032]|uniref:hypothetical protein n=1 Tax=Streptomyces sp. NPDC094032 TaxID=3155308 RepID=UPI0033296DFD
MGTTVVRVVVGDVVTGYAPEEVPVLAALAHVDDAEVVRILRGRRKGEPLGFGFAEVAAVVTPVVWLAVDEACRSAVQSSVGSAYARLAGVTRRLLRRPSAESATEVPELSRDQLDVVHRRVTEDARTAGLAAEDAERLADRVVARLILARPTSEGTGTGRDGDGGGTTSDDRPGA